jgi:hypothetical protein
MTAATIPPRWLVAPIAALGRLALRAEPAPAVPPVAATLVGLTGRISGTTDAAPTTNPFAVDVGTGDTSTIIEESATDHRKWCVRGGQVPRDPQ